MLEKVKTLGIRVGSFIKKYELTDVRTIGLLAFGFIAATVTWNGAKAIQMNFDLQKKVVVLEEQNKVLALENETQALKNEYYKTDEYKELSVRRLFGKAAPGENIYIVPKEVALKYASPTNSTVDDEQPLTTPTTVTLPAYQQHIQDWLDFFFHRSPSV